MTAAWLSAVQPRRKVQQLPMFEASMAAVGCEASTKGAERPGHGPAWQLQAGTDSAVLLKELETSMAAAARTKGAAAARA